MRPKIPFLPFQYRTLIKITDRFLGVGELLSAMFPSLGYDLQHSDIEVNPRRWMSIAFFAFIFYFIFLTIPLIVITIAARIPIARAVGVSLLAGLAMGSGVFFFMSFYPKLKAQRKIKDIERNLPYALHHMLVQIRSGVTLYDTLLSIARRNYGILSDEMREVINEINTGKSEIEALEKITRDTPSFFFRRVMWQIINAMKSGADVGDTLKEIVENLSVEQRVAIKKYGSQLNPLALMYMLFAVIFPTLGITFLLVLVSFTGLDINLEIILTGIVIVLVIFQFMFVGLIKSRRPVGID